VIGALIKLAVFIVVVAFIYNVCTPGCGGSKGKKSNSVISEKAVASQNDLLTKEDSVEVRNKLSDINRFTQLVYESSEKAKSKCERSMRLYANNSVNEYEVYKTAEIAKETFDDKSHKINEINTPDKLPANLKDTFNMAVSDLGTYYNNMSDAYGIIMNTLDNGGKFSDIKKYQEQVAMARQFYEKGMFNLLIVENRMGLLKNKKAKHKN
jgi:hypothetical protein